MWQLMVGWRFGNSELEVVLVLWITRSKPMALAES